MEACECGKSLGNTGEPNCQPIFKDLKKLIVVPMQADDGTDNYIDLDTPITQSIIDGWINNADPSKRFYPLPIMEDVGGERAASLVQTSAGGTKNRLKQGERTANGSLWNQSPQFLGQLETMACRKIGIFMMDSAESIQGTKKEAFPRRLYPIRVNENSWDPILVFAVDGTNTQMINLAWDFHTSEQDKNLRMIIASEYVGDLYTQDGLLDIFAEFSAITTTGFTAKLFSLYGTAGESQPDTGLLITDFDINNVTDDLPITILTMTESPDGTYTFTFAAQGAGEDYQLIPSKTGRDYTAVSDEVIPG